MKFYEAMEEMGACKPAVNWLRENGYGLARAWKNCSRGDWMIWLCEAASWKPGWPTQEEIIQCVGYIVEDCLRLLPDDEDRPRIALETALDWCNGRATEEDVVAAAAGAFAAEEGEETFSGSRASYAAGELASAAFEPADEENASFAVSSAANAFGNDEVKAKMREYAFIVRNTLTIPKRWS
jgi:hypothetical protein